MKIKKSGFTLLELMIVVVIIGVLASVALPKLFSVIKKTKYVEAMEVCRSIIHAEILYFLHNNRFTPDVGDLPIGLPPSAVEGGSYYSWYFNPATVTDQIGFGIGFDPENPDLRSAHKIGVDLKVDSSGYPDVYFYWWREDAPGKIGGGNLHASGGFGCCAGCGNLPGFCTDSENGWPGLR